MGVDPAAVIRLTFDQPMDRASVEAALTIQPPIDGATSWEGDTLIFTPTDNYLKESTEYSVSVAPTIRSAEGAVVLHSEYRWSFHTTRWDDVAQFGDGLRVQVLDATGRRAVQFMTLRPQYRSLTFELYRLSQKQFFANYAASVAALDNYTQASFDSTGLVLVRQWSEEPSHSITLDYYSDAHVQETFIPADTPPGLYLLNLKAASVNDQLLVVLTHHTLVVKQTPDEILAWVTDFAGQPQPDVAVDAMASGGWSVGGCRTDAQGLCRLTPNPLNPPLLVAAQTGDDVTLAGLTQGWRNWQVGSGPSAHYAVSVYTDQPVYVFGETVNFKAIVRQDNDGGLSVPPAGTVVTVELQRVWGEPLRTIYLTTDEFGAVHSLFRLDAETLPREYEPPMYTIVARIGGEAYSHQFTAHNGAEVEYTVSLTTDAPAYVAGDLMTITGHVQDAAGQPVAGARVNLAQYEANNYSGYCWYPTCWMERYNTRLTGRTDAAGNVTFYVIAEQSYAGQTLALNLTATANNKSGQALVLVDMLERAATLSLALPNGNFYAPGQTFDVAVSGRTILDEPLGGAPLQLTLNRWDATREAYTAVVQAFDLTTDAEGRASQPLTVAEPGHYQLRLTGRDSRGNTINAVRDVYIFGDDLAWPSDVPTPLMRLVADHDQYAPGDTASVLIESAFSGPALLTLERGTVRRAEAITLTAPLTRLALPIQADDAPNVHVTVQAWRPISATLDEHTFSSLADASLYAASLNLPVPVTGKELNITITPDKTEYAPGETAAFHIRVTDANGQPVVGQFSLALTDERTFATNPGHTALRLGNFYYQRNARPALYDALEPHRSLLWDEHGGCGGDGGWSELPSISTPAGVFWEPALTTDANGELTITLTLPDAPGQWRLTAAAVTLDTQVGETALRVTSR
jgi:hypothetical protein